jgi:hypothetical protein
VRVLYPVLLVGAGLAVFLASGVKAPALVPAKFVPPEKVKKLLGEKGAAVVANATKVEVFRIDSRRTGKDDDKHIAGYPITAKGKEQGKEFAAKVRKALFDVKTYTGDSARCYEPGVAFRIWNGKDALDVVVCFRCANFQIGLKGDKKDDDELDLFGFGPSLEPFLALAKEALPDDREIQALKSK